MIKKTKKSESLLEWKLFKMPHTKKVANENLNLHNTMLWKKVMDDNL